jgi:TFIIF-interacting CTD phosphatase-like protein
MCATKNESKLNILLDLDSTLIYAEPIDEFPFKDANVSQKALNLSVFNMDDYYIIFGRPHLKEFLEFLVKNFNVSIWTAASKDYALFIIGKILQLKPEDVDYIFFSYHCKLSENSYDGDQKNLRLLWEELPLSKTYNKNNTLILDDYDHIQEIQPGNCIPAHPFNVIKDKNKFNDECVDDDFLKKLIPTLKKIKKNWDGTEESLKKLLHSSKCEIPNKVE